MSMLAEKRRKQKWLLNPQGKHWLSESNKFGLKILEGLGWKEGKGLGKQQDGITEPIKILYKNDSKGLGLKETQSSVQQEHFSNLLESLNNSTSNRSLTQISSLEEKSQNSRSRVHYKKFTRGKDLSRYSKKDLASIFEKKPDEQEKETTATKDRNVNMGSMTDYFKNRVPRLQLQREQSDDEGKPGFGFKNPAFEPLGQNFTLLKRKLEPITEIENEKDVSLIVDDLDNNACEQNIFEVKRKSKKTKSKKKQKRLQVSCNDNRGIDNPLLCINDSVNTQSGNDDTVHIKKKAKKQKNDIESNISEGTNSIKRKKNGEDLNQTIKILKKRATDSPKSKSENEEVGVDNPAFNPASSADVQCDLILNVVEEPVVERKRPKLSKKVKNFGCDNYGFDAKAQRIEENMVSLSNTIETYQAEVENDINECKDVKIKEEDLMVGDFNNGYGENERREDGVLLRFKYASFSKDPYWAFKYDQSATLAKKSYKHLIRGDITVEFKDSNLHEIKGYGNRV